MVFVRRSSDSVGRVHVFLWTPKPAIGTRGMSLDSTGRAGWVDEHDSPLTPPIKRKVAAVAAVAAVASHRS
jgi:hypothetical protein